MWLRKLLRSILVLVTVVMAGRNVVAQPKSTERARAQPTTKPVLSQAELEEKFEETMSNAGMVGSYTLTGSNKPPAEDRYTLGSVTRKEGDTWIFVSTIQFGGMNISLPLK